MATAALDHAPVRLRTLLTLAGPVVASRLGIMAMGVTDTLVVGRYSAVELSHLALAWAPTGVILVTAVGLLQGVQVLTAQAIGAGRPQDTGAVLRRGTVYALGLGLGLALLLAVAGPVLLGHLGLDAALAAGAAPVLRLLAWSLLPMLLVDAGIFWLEAQGRPLPATAAMWAANGVNLLINLWLVPGHSGFAVAGATASAAATLVSRTALLLFVAGYIVRWPAARGFGVFRTPGPDAPGAAALRRIGYGAAASYFVEMAAFNSMTIVAGWLGAAGVAAWAIVLNVAGVTFMGPLGIAAATAVLVGRAHGAGDPAGVRRAGTLGFATAAAVSLLVSAVILGAADAVAGGYTRDAAVRAVAAAALVLSCLFYLTDGLQAVGAQALRARGDIWMPAATHMVSYVGVLMPAGYVAAIVLHLGVAGIVWGTIVASAVSAGLLLARFYWLGRRAL
ncbi:MAG: MATE family efflux transporter [Sphingomonadaceae bacterium]|nr:MATE family efflux transporter [Sphingomonadaceae bacterium]